MNDLTSVTDPLKISLSVGAGNEMRTQFLLLFSVQTHLSHSLRPSLAQSQPYVNPFVHVQKPVNDLMCGLVQEWSLKGRVVKCKVATFSSLPLTSND